MLTPFVWFENSQTAVNMDKVLGFKVKETDDSLELHLWLLQTDSVTGDGWGYIIQDAEDIRNFLQNVAKLDELPDSLNVSQVVETVEAGASVTGIKIDRL